MPASQNHPLLSSQPFASKGKIITADEAVRLIRDGDTVATGGFVGIGFAEHLAIALETHFLTTGRPRNLTLVYAAGQGDGKDRGLNHLGHENLVRRIIGGHWGLVPKLGKLSIDNKVEAYNLPQGVISHLFRDIAAHKPGTLSRVGLGTFVDPRFGGGKMNAITTKDIVELMSIDGKEYLFYKAFPINVALIRGTSADPDGNITMEKEALILEVLAIATAVHNSGGVVIVQVERLAERGSLHPRKVKIPAVLVDCIVVAPPEQHWQTFATPYNPAFSGEIRVPMQSIPAMPLSQRKLIARRAAFEILPNSVVNLGIGMPEGIANVANEERIIDLMTLTAEPGVLGGIPAGGLNFGAATNTQAVIDQPAQFDFYDGGGLDIAFLGMAQVDREGNVNVSKFGNKLVGAGGFINISQNAKRVVFVGTFSNGGETSIENEQLRISHLGKSHKFVAEVEHRTFSGSHAAAKGQSVLYITERCVFQLTREGMELIEIAPGLDLQRDILAQMDFQPIMKQPPRLMADLLFRAEPMGLRRALLRLPVEERFTYDAEEDLFFVNLEGYEIKTLEDAEAIRQNVSNHLSPLGRKTYAVVNYDNFTINPDLIDPYTDIIKDLMDRFYWGVTRYTTSAFLRMKLGDALEQRDVAPYIFESPGEARRHLRDAQSGLTDEELEIASYGGTG
ncbi:MAG: acyl CoA:acetate/3-ketoacid CoA transferase [Candidatus Competibacteraceae bacterium]|nr:acyl CoA:acetate/3-ketoacid CoA transferase [Candidatus Competibacteraceae bacterium]